MVVADFLTFVGRMRGMGQGRLRERLAEMVERVHLAEVWSRPIDTLSKGYRRRVGIAQALLHDPDVLILDEPTDGLDPNQKHDMRALIRSIARDKAIVVSTHILEEVEAVCTRAVIIARGKVVADAEPHALMARAAKGRAIRVTVASPDEAAVLQRLEPAARGRRLELLERVDGATRILVHLEGETLEPATLAADLAGSGLPIEEVGIWRPRLEDVFRDVTQRVH
jgi:ABC-2 type transport system ATP-binding protein